MSNVLKQRALNFLNQMEVIESQGGEEAYALVENNEENRYLLTEAGIPLETALKYGDEETFCIIALAFGEGYADLYTGNKLISYEKSQEIEVAAGQEVVLYKYKNEIYISISEDGGYVSTVKLTEEQANKFRNILSE